MDYHHVKDNEKTRYSQLFYALRAKMTFVYHKTHETNSRRGRRKSFHKMEEPRGSLTRGVFEHIADGHHASGIQEGLRSPTPARLISSLVPEPTSFDDLDSAFNKVWTTGAVSSQAHRDGAC